MPITRLKELAGSACHWICTLSANWIRKHPPILELSAPGVRRRGGLPGCRQTGGSTCSKFLNADQSDVRFWLRRYEVDKVFIEHGWWPGEDDLHDAVVKTGIPSIEVLEAELAHYLGDFSRLGTTRDNPY